MINLKISKKNFATFCLIFFCGIVFSQNKIYSDLWGKNGELWDKKGRISDFSFAGYNQGLISIPNDIATVNLKLNYGAVGDGITDDTQAFKKAIAENKGVLFIPPGKYVITEILRINQSNVILRGAGENKTILYFPKSLMEIEPRHIEAESRVLKGKAHWYHGQGGHIWADGNFGQQKLTAITKPASRGDQSLQIDNPKNLKIDDLVEIFQKDDTAKSLLKYLYNDDLGDVTKLNGKVWQIVKITAIKGKTISFDRGLRFAIDTKWQPIINSYNP